MKLIRIRWKKHVSYWDALLHLDMNRCWDDHITVTFFDLSGRVVSLVGSRYVDELRHLEARAYAEKMP